MACTATKNNTCQIVRHLPVWNEFLCKARLQLQETLGKHGQLSLTACQGIRTYQASRDEFEQAAALVYWLLKSHGCVAVIDIRGNIWNAHRAIVANALRDSALVKSLTVCTSSLDIHSGLSEVVSTLTNLREFECTGNVKFEVQLEASLPLLLRGAKSLTALRISALRWRNCQAARHFSEALEEASALTELSIHDSALAKLQCSTMAMHVMSTLAVSTLTLQVSNQPSRDTLYLSLWGLALNRSILKVCLVNLRLHELVVPPLMHVWRENPVLRSFHMVSTQHDFSEYDRRGYASVLLLNNTLEEVTLPLHVWDELEWEQFFAALAEKSALRKVTIEVFFIDPAFMREVSDSIKEGDVEDKVFFRDMRFKAPTDIFEFAPIKLEGSRLSEAYIQLPFETGSGRLSRILRVLPSCGPVTSLELPADLYDLNDALLSALGNYIGSTTTLRTFRVSTENYSSLMPQFNASPDRFWTVITEALRENGSIRHLGLVPQHISEKVAKDLVDVMRTSPNICKAHFGTRERLISRAVVQGLSSAVAQDCRLIKVTLKDMRYKDLDRDWFAIQDAVGQNCRMVTRAAQYVTGAVCDRYRACALEKISRHPVLLEEVAELASVSVHEVAGKLREGLRRSESLDDFMRLAGVVKERVQCHARADGRMQIDGLNVYCWARVRRYLKLEDVRE